MHEWRLFLERLPDDWPFVKPQRVQAIDGTRVKAPSHWKSTQEEWNDLRSYLRLIEYSINNNFRSILILRDDAVFCDGFVQKMSRFIRHIDRWQGLHLGDRIPYVRSHSHSKINRHLYKAAYGDYVTGIAMRGRMFQSAYEYLLERGWENECSVNQRLNQLIKQKRNTYISGNWMIGRLGSDVNL